MIASSECVHSLDGYKVAGNAAYLCAHACEHLTQLLQIGLAGCIVYCSLSLGKHGSHNDVGRSCHRCLVEQHAASFQTLGSQSVCLSYLVLLESRSQLLQSCEVRVETTAANLVATGLCNDGFSESCEQRAHEHHRASEARTAFQKFGTLQIFQINVVCLEGEASLACLAHRNAHSYEQRNEIVDVENVGYVLHCHFFGGEQCGAYYLQYFVLCSLRNDCSVQSLAAFYYE